MSGRPTPATPPDGREADRAAALAPEEEERLFGDLEQRIDTADRSWHWRLRSLPTWARWVATGVVFALMVAVVLSAVRRGDWALVPVGRMAIELAALGVAVLVAFALVLRPLHRRQPGSAVSVAFVVLLALVPFGIALLPPMHGGSPGASEPFGAVVLHALPCLGMGLLFGLPVLLVARLFDRGVARGPLWAAVAAGLAANFGLELHCAVGLPLHDLLGHAAVTLVFVAGAVAVSRFGRRGGAAG